MEPVEHAEPVEISTPSWSILMTMASAGMPRMEMLRVLGRLFSGVLMWMLSIWLSPAMSWDFNWAL